MDLENSDSNDTEWPCMTMNYSTVKSYYLEKQGKDCKAFCTSSAREITFLWSFCKMWQQLCLTARENIHCNVTATQKGITTQYCQDFSKTILKEPLKGTSDQLPPSHTSVLINCSDGWNNHTPLDIHVLAFSKLVMFNIRTQIFITSLSGRCCIRFLPL